MAAPRRRSMFVGALLPVCATEVLLVAVKPFITADAHEASLYALAFQMRFGRPVVLVSTDDARVPTYWGPPPIVYALALLPFELIPWRAMALHVPKLRTWPRLPIPRDAPADTATNEDVSPSSDDLERTHVFDRAGSTTRR